MKIYSIYDKEFIEFGKVVDLDFADILSKLKAKECPKDNTVYIPSDNELENTEVAKQMEIDWFGGMPVQIGYCNGHNDTLNCLEYHKSSEINICANDTILLLARKQDIENRQLDTSTVKAFLVPANCGVELYATSLHYAPCGVSGNGFRVAVVLPKGTNLEKPKGATCPLLWGSNKWLLAHNDAPEAKQGAYIGLVGKNLKVN